VNAHEIVLAKLIGVLSWSYRGQAHTSRIVADCPTCGERATVVELPRVLCDEQPDGTTHVCHPLLAGCNGGFALTPAVDA
jgi:hypothetical protein